MVHRKPFRPTPPPIDRRSGRDRRQVDKAPPGGRDRRVGLEPRRPEVVELEVSAAEWLALQAAMTATAQASSADAAAASSNAGVPLPGQVPGAAGSVPAQPGDTTRTTGVGRER